LTGLISCCSRDSQESSSVPQLESINYLALSLICDPTFTSIHNCWGKQKQKQKQKHNFDNTDLFQQSVVSGFNMMSRVLISWLKSQSAVILEPKKI